MNNEDVKEFLVQKAMESESPISLRTLVNQFSKQYPQRSTKITQKEITKLLDSLNSWRLPIGERVSIAFIFQTKVSDEMKREIKELPNLIIGVDEKKNIVSFASPALLLNRLKRTRGQTIEYIGGNTNQVPMHQDGGEDVNNLNVENDTPPQRRASPPRRANQQDPAVQNDFDLHHRLVGLPDSSRF